MKKKKKPEQKREARETRKLKALIKEAKEEYWNFGLDAEYDLVNDDCLSLDEYIVMNVMLRYTGESPEETYRKIRKICQRSEKEYWRVHRHRYR